MAETEAKVNHPAHGSEPPTEAPKTEPEAKSDAGHVCNVDQPDVFSQQVLAFLDQPDLR